MRYVYCPVCGQKLIERPIGDEGPVPFCDNCSRPWFDTFSTCIIALVYNGRGDVALLRQSYISQKYRNLVSGYMKPGESAEEAAAREIGEELGVPVVSVRPAGTFWFGKKELLMVGFFAEAGSGAFRLSGEVEAAEWVPAGTALGLVHPEGSASYGMIKRFLER